jgi:hypothetical protein
MIRVETDSGWMLIEHREHARLAGEFAAHWGNADFAGPEPRGDILMAVSRHEDSWLEHDARPRLDAEGAPSALSQEFVGTTAAPRGVELAQYLDMLGRTTESIAAEVPFAAIIVSMNNFDMVTSQTDVRGLSDADKALRRKFLDGQLQRQVELIGSLESAQDDSEDLAPSRVLRAFEFLQACDSLALVVSVRCPRPVALRHRHPLRNEAMVELVCSPLGGDAYRVSPFPFDADALEFELPSRTLRQKSFQDDASFRAAYSGAPLGRLKVRITR